MVPDKASCSIKYKHNIAWWQHTTCWEKECHMFCAFQKDSNLLLTCSCYKLPKLDEPWLPTLFLCCSELCSSARCLLSSSYSCRFRSAICLCFCNAPKQLCSSALPSVYISVTYHKPCIELFFSLNELEWAVITLCYTEHGKL